MGLFNLIRFFCFYTEVPMTARTLAIERAESRFGWRLILPAVIIIGGLILYPIAYNIFLSFFDVTLQGDRTYVGLTNYRSVLLDPTFWRAVLTTLIYVVGTTIGTTLVGLGVALVMSRKFPLRGLVGTFTPMCVRPAGRKKNSRPFSGGLITTLSNKNN